MDVFFSTIVRTAPIKQAGELVRLNWDTKQIVAKVPIFPDNPEVDDPNPRGNTRGGRGIIVLDDKVICASWHTLKMYDLNLNEIPGSITHPLMTDLHELYLDPAGTLLVSSTALDAVLELDLTTGEILREYWPRDMEGIRQKLGVEPLDDFDRNADNRILFVTRPYRREPNHLHINAASRCCDEVYALANKFGAILNLDRDEVVLVDPCLKGAHNLVPDAHRLYITDTDGRKVHVYDTWTGHLDTVTDIRAFAEIRRIEDRCQPPAWKTHIHKLKRTPLQMLKHTPIRRLYYKARLNEMTPAAPLFTRGLDVSGDVLFVGFSPATIAMVDRYTGALLDMYQYSKDVKVCVHGLKVHQNGAAAGNGQP